MVGKGSKLTMLPRGSRKLSARLVASAFKKRCSPNTSPEVIQRAYWNPSLEKSLVDILHEYKDSGFRGDNGWSSEGWNKMVKVFHERNKYVSFSKGQIQEKTGQLKRDYQMLKEAKKQSGCHWNENRCMIEGGPALWENLIVKFPKIKKFRNAKATFPLFDALGALYDEGTYNVTSLGDEEPLQQIHDLEDEEQLRQTHYVEDEESLRQIHDLEDEEQLRQTHYVEDEESLRQIHDLEDEETQEDRAEEHMDEEHRTAHQKRVAAIPRHNEENEPKRARTSKIVSMMEKYCEMKTKHAKDEAAREKEITREKLIAGGKECAQCPDFSIMRCILVLDTMEVTKVEKARAYTVFKTPENREIFLSACSKDPEAAMIWLRSEMEAAKVMAAGT